MKRKSQASAKVVPLDAAATDVEAGAAPAANNNADKVCLAVCGGERVCACALCGAAARVCGKQAGRAHLFTFP